MADDLQDKLLDVARKVTEEIMDLPHWSIGDIVEHPDGYPVKIMSGTLWREFPDGGQRLVNTWTWQQVDSSGEPSGINIEGPGWATDPRVSAPSFGH